MKKIIVRTLVVLLFFILVVFCVGLWSASKIEGSYFAVEQILSQPDLPQDIRAKLSAVKYKLRKEHKQEAIAILSEIPESQQNFHVIGLYAMISIELGDWDLAIIAGQRMVKQQPDNSASYLVLGQAYGGKGMFPESAAALEKAIKLDPDNLGAQEFLGFAYVEMGAVEKAKKQYEILRDKDYMSALSLLKAIKEEKVAR